MNHLTIQHLPELPFDMEESINQLRVNLGFCGDQIKTVVITSSIPNEGKSFIAVYLWKMLAELGSRVLLIDCDLRKSEMRTKYGISSAEKITGIAHYLAGKVELQDAVYETNIPNGYMIPLSAPVANPSILLENPRFSEMIETCAGKFDYVLIDTPPLESVADTLHIAATRGRHRPGGAQRPDFPQAGVGRSRQTETGRSVHFGAGPQQGRDETKRRLLL